MMKEGSFIGGFFLGFLGGIIGLIIALCLDGSQTRKGAIVGFICSLLFLVFAVLLFLVIIGSVVAGYYG